MNWFRRSRAPRPDLPAEVRASISRWQALPAGEVAGSVEQTRFVVVDTETSGLNPASDTLLSIGAVTVQGGRALIDHSFYAVLRQEVPSSDENILIHGLGRGIQEGGIESALSLGKFLDFMAGGVLVAFPAPFDAKFIARAMDRELGIDFAPRWFDLARALPATFPDFARRKPRLDDWFRHFGIAPATRHDALADAMATAELLLVLIAHASHGQKSLSLDALLALDRAHTWLP